MSVAPPAASPPGSQPASQPGSPSGSPPVEGHRPGGWSRSVLVSLLALVLLLELLAVSYLMLAMALPEISRAFATSQGIWLMTGFLLVGTVASPLMGKLADVHGKRRILLTCVVISAAGSVSAALAPSFAWLLVSWSAVGLLSPCLFLVYSLIRDVFPTSTVTLAVSVSTTGMGLIAIPAPAVAGWVIDTFGWRGVFWFCAVALLSLAGLIRATTPESPVRLESRVDLLGAVLLATGLGGVLVAVSMGDAWGWTSARTLVSGLGGAAVLVGWFISARTVKDPVVDLQILVRPAVLFTTLSSGMAWAVVAAVSVLLPMTVMMSQQAHLGYGFGLSHTQYSWVQVPMGSLTLVGGFLVGSLVTRGFAARATMLLGLAATACGAAGLGLGHHHLSMVVAWAGLIGLGTGMAYAATPNLLIESVPPELQASSGAIASVSGNLFPAVLPVLVFALLNARFTAAVVEGAPLYSDAGIRAAFLLCAACAALGWVAALALPRRR